jgi:type VI protein secretion system component VasK
VNDRLDGKPLRASIVAGILFVVMAVALAWVGWVARDAYRDNADVLCEVLALQRQAEIELLAVTPGTSDDLSSQLKEINAKYERITSPIRNCDVRRNVPRP